MPAGTNRRRWWRHWLAALCLLPLLAFALSNLWLSSPWTRDWLASKIKRRCGGLQTHIGSASWSPWNGITLRKIVVSQPAELSGAITEPLLHIDSLRLTPRWRSCWHSHFDVLAADIEGPRLVISPLMLPLLARQGPPPTAPPDAQPALPPIAALQAERPSTPTAQTSIPSEPAASEPGPADAKPPPPASPRPPAADALQPTCWVHLRHASLILVAGGSAPPWVEIAGLSSDFPLSGQAATSSLALGSFKLHGTPVLTNFNAPLAWESPILSLKPVETTLLGVHIELAAKFALLGGLPIQVEIKVPAQSPASFTLPAGGEGSAAHILGGARFRGFLTAPGTWQGDCLAETAAISIKTSEHHATFDNGNCCFALRGGVLSCLDARLIGENLSLLGNATLLADGRAAGVLRLVSAPETTLGILKHFFPAADPVLTPMASPQRVACDVEVSGSLGALQLSIGHHGPIVQP
ncbi:MAG: hypothetical protein WCJ66_03190 [Verrucomicrobiota bacterium]